MKYIKVVEPQMKLLEDRMPRVLSSGSHYVDLCVSHALRNKGKRIRPLMVFLSGGACGGFKDAHVDAAVAVELLHTATLLHDDVIDDADIRRNFETHNSKFGNQAAVIFGDYMLSCALCAAASDGLISCRGVFSKAAKDICEWEMEQIYRRFYFDVTEEGYLKIIEKKTAVLFAAACEIGAIVSGADKQIQKMMYDFGIGAGTAFQIMDDLIDIYGKAGDAGKPVRGDVKRGDFTLPVIHLLNNAEDCAKIRAVLHPEGADAGIDSVIRLLRENDETLKYCISAAKRHIESAKKCLEKLQPSVYRNSLGFLADDIVNLQKLDIKKTGVSLSVPVSNK